MSADSAQDQPKLYTELAAWWPLLSQPADYAEEAGFYLSLLLERFEGERASVLELGSGGGNNASHMKFRCDLTLVDPAEGMLAVSRGLNPECEHVVGDMRTVRLERTFDAVFAHDAVCHLLDEDDLERTARTAWDHLRPGGTAVFAPDYVAETLALEGRSPEAECGGHDAADGSGRGLRYLSWVSDPDPSDTTYLVDYAYLLRDADGSVRVEHDRHVEGVFPRATWLRVLEEAGFEARIEPLVHSEVEPGRHEVFVARRPG